VNREALRPPRAVYAGLFAVTLGTLMHEILLTRIFSVTMWYHFAFVAISVAMFGMTLGAVIVYLRPQHFPAEIAPRRLAQASLLYAVSIVVAFLVYAKIPFLGPNDTAGIALLSLSYVVITIPFVFSGITVAVALTRFPAHVGRLYAVDLIGAALGCVLLIVTIDLAGGPTSMLVVASIVALGALAFSAGASDRSLLRRAAVVAGVLGVVTLVHGVLERQNKPFIDLVDTGKQTVSAYHYVRWNSHSRVTVFGNPFEPIKAVGWGLSRKTGAADRTANQLGMTIDTWAGTVITHFDGNTAGVDYLKDDVSNIAHYLRPGSDVYVVGVGGGRDVLSALVFDQKSVTGVEINNAVLGATTRQFADFAGHLEQNPKVTLAVDEARSYLSRSKRKFGIIQLSLIDTWAATAAGAFVLTENALYTVQAWRTFLEHLVPGGILTVTRWYYPTRPGETLRITSLARAALDALGVEAPRRHVAIVRAPKANGLPGELGNGIATILVSRDPLSAADLAVLERQTQRLGFDLVVTPDRAEAADYETILSRDPKTFYENYPLDVTAPTDDSPFFFQMVRFGDFAESLVENMFDPNRANLEAIRLLGVLLLIVSVLTISCIFVPLALTTQRDQLRGGAPLLIFFLAIGLGFMFVEISQMQRLMVFLGHPTYALSVVLFTLLVGGGLGSYLTERVVRRGIAAHVVLGALVATLAVFGFATPQVISGLSAAPQVLRIAAAVVILGSIGVVMGMPFPLGMRAAAERAPALTPWLWGVNGAAGVLCSVLAVVVALTAGISAAFWAGVVCYAVAGVALLRVTRAGRVAPRSSAVRAAAEARAELSEVD
jgi:SAM-dependent methyltransferase